MDVVKRARLFLQRFYERAFRFLAGAKALESTRDAHELGRTALGLSP
ncbi:MAG TPA: hypothetical protein VFZ09_36265 [Archangium sp.]|nr:hypothetical protein [Archangium sp.]HEX5751731.1 hypothetical protein [Archangium sp.]